MSNQGLGLSASWGLVRPCEPVPEPAGLASRALPAAAGIDLSTGSGGIRIDLPDDAAFEIDARTNSGDVRTDHPVVVRDETRRGQLQGTVRGGGPKVTLRTDSGDIAID